MHVSRRSLLGLAGASASALALGACGDGGSGKDGKTTVNWWHISNTDPMLSVWAALAKDFEAKHPDVTIKITPLENEAFKSKLTTVTQGGSPPDLFSTWGGGVLKQQVDAGLVKDLTADFTSLADTFTPLSTQPYRLDNKVYGVPFDLGMVGFWYNKELFGRAGIASPPDTWTGLLDAVRKLKAAGITPIALAGGDKWPGHYYWAYLAMRIGGLDVLKQAGADAKFDKPEFVAAGTKLKELVDLAPFQKGFLAATYGSPDGQAATMGNGAAAMELMGQWAPSVQNDTSTNKKGIGDKLGFFPFPAVEGGKGAVTEAFGGGNGFAVGRNAPPATIEFLKFLVQVDNQRKAAATGAVVPVVKGAEDAIKDPNIAAVQKTLAAATGFQLFLDQAYPPAVGQQVNDSVAELIAGKASPQQVVRAVTDAAHK
ncbi:extracellular solute-binding protein [Planosporangium mesophilum]|uniref:ABC transporter substrate-binding protein n=1 Tax=Planosporangium mesophilum TaxID=689768 RepID=A0A8J3TG26_9ACTN|nr:extracellular solute-binding protein [Planosporangium mesophilum]NJC85055.1 extracellular solute-binding protein [Planosporangium mesophilum]GII24492.1 ABC transporter substrate-binding protein [Planosporangium mesophilum]